MKEIPLTKGYVALVDDEDFEELSEHRWFAQLHPGNRVYAFCHTPMVNGKNPHSVFMHRQIMGFPVGLEIDHIDGNGLNNQRTNLRACTHAQNCANHKTYRSSTWGVSGVRWSRQRQQWGVWVRISGKEICQGYCPNKDGAIRLRDAKLKELHGEFARAAK